jgi:isocitrate lyase
MTFDDNVAAAQEFIDGERFAGVTRLYSARQVAEQQGSITVDHPVARENAVAFYARLRELFAQKRSITTYGPYSPSQAVTMKRQGIEGIYLGGWATSAKGSVQEDPGADLASYPLSQVPDEAAGIVRALLTADRNQTYQRSRLSAAELAAAPAAVDYRPFIIADADTGHGGDAHVRNLIRRFVEVGVTGYHIEDQRPGAKKCGHQGGKVLVGVDEQIKRLNAARLQLDTMRVPGIIVARTDAEAATLLDNSGDERDHPFILGATNLTVPSYKLATLALMRIFHDAGHPMFDGYTLYAITDDEYASADEWLERTGIRADAEARAEELRGEAAPAVEVAYDRIVSRMVGRWETDAGVMTIGEAGRATLERTRDEGGDPPIGVDEWTAFARTASFWTLRRRARDLGLSFSWDADLARTPEGYYQVRGGLEYAIAKSLAVAPFADLIWMETASADIAEAREFAEAIHARFPSAMLAYNLSPSFNWDSTGMTDDEMREFPRLLGESGFVFNFITYGGHQIDGVAAEEFSTALLRDGMLALAQIQRRIRLIESPYRTPQTHVGGPRLDAALAAASARTATTKAMGKGSTQVQHLVQTELPKKVLEDWLADWATYNKIDERLRVTLRPSRDGADVLELSVLGQEDAVRANVVFAPASDRHGQVILSVRDQNTVTAELRRRRLMTLVHVYLISRYQASSVHYLTPTEDNDHQSRKMAEQGIYSAVSPEIGQIIVAQVDADTVRALSDDGAMGKFIRRES